MATPPEVLFDRFFRGRPHLLRDGYLGKMNLDQLTGATLPVSLLYDLQGMLNASLLHENTNIPEHVDHAPFHFDYVISDEPNALAFCADGYSFIGITVPFVDQLWSASTRLSESAELQAMLRTGLTAEHITDADIARRAYELFERRGREHGHDLADWFQAERELTEMTLPQRMQVVLFRLQFFFVALHEFSHVVHGHVRRGDDSSFSKEVLPQPNGSIEKQGRESDADGYAIYFLLTNVFNGSEERNHLLRVLGKENASAEEQDDVLFSAFIMAAAAFIFAQTPKALADQDVYKRTHPLHVVRLRMMMKAAYAWCDQNRPALCPRTRGPQVHALIRLLAGVVSGPDGQARWDEQIEFVRSDAGKPYDNAVEAECVRLVRALGASTSTEAT